MKNLRLSAILILMISILGLSNTIRTSASPAPNAPAVSPAAWHCVADGSPSPCYPRYTDVHVISPEEAWVTGGEMLHRVNRRWERVLTPMNPIHLNGMDFLASNDGWAVGLGGKIIHWDGQRWTQVSSPTQSDLFDVDMLSATEGWIVGDNEILRWDGKEWASYPHGLASRFILRAVHILSSTEGWAAGDLTGIMHWDGSQWRNADQVENSYAYYIMDIELDGPGRGVAVGALGAVLYGEDGYWQSVGAYIENSLNALDLLSAGEAWTVGDNGVIYHFQDGFWQPVTSPTGKNLNDVEMAADGTGWAVGDHGLILRYADGEWKVERDGLFGGRWDDIEMLSSQDGWRVGYGGVIQHWNGSAWMSVASPTQEYIWGVDFTAPDDGWAVTYEHILHWDGKAWSIHTERFGLDVMDNIFALAADNVWVTGAHIYHWDGQEWAKATSDLYPGPNVIDMDGVSPKDLWAAGYNGFYHWNGSIWEKREDFGVRIDAIGMASATEGWAWGYPHQLFHWDGHHWTEVDNPQHWYMLDVEFSSPSNGWAVGNAILHWDGSQWTQVASPISVAYLWAVSVPSDTEAWAIALDAFTLRTVSAPPQQYIPLTIRAR